jgi:ferredoxin/flavodoxin---NADP+ reductase
MSSDAIRVAVIGAGPAGFYATGHLLGQRPGVISVDLYDRLPTPWGLVRSGVAPDHPKLKQVSAVFEGMAELEGFRFLGNVSFGSDVTRGDLLAHYHAIVYAVGAEADRRLGIPGEDLPGSHSAAEFVGWYNGHPDYADRRFDLSGERAIVVGNGNVALDLARMLVLPHDELARTDIADQALHGLGRSGVGEVVISGRRGPRQAAFTSPELAEFSGLPGVRVEVHDASLLTEAAPTRNGALSVDGTVSVPRSTGAETERKLSLLAQFGVASGGDGECLRRVEFRFLCSPVEIRGEKKVEEVVFERNELSRDESGCWHARPTGKTETLAAGLVLRAVGYRGHDLKDVPFDAASRTIAHRLGRVIDASGAPLAGEYCVGWAKRGPQGVIGTNRRDALETVTALLEDLDAGKLNEAAEPTSESVDALLSTRGVTVVDHDSWRRIDAHERRRGAPENRPRVKVCRWQDLLAVAGQSG